MKKLFNILLAILVLFAFAPILGAQDVPFPADPSIKFSQEEWSKEYTIDNSNVAYRKIISKPNTQGIYHILLDAFVTGREVKINQALRADIVLVLDVSTSMNENLSGNTKRITALKTAVNTFIDLINDNDLDNAPTQGGRLGNRIAIVPFGSGISTSGNNQVRGFNTLNNATTIKSQVNNLTIYNNQGTSAHLGMQRALQLLQNSTAQIRTVVLFTDGNPGYYGQWESRSNVVSPYYYDNETYQYQNTWYSANHTIDYASQIKKLATDKSDPNYNDPTKRVIANVFTVSVINNPSPYTNVYLGKTSSNWDKTTTDMGSITVDRYGVVSGWNSTDIWANGSGARAKKINEAGEETTENETKYAITASNASQLEEAFATIASSTGGTSEGLGSSSIATVDVVSASFILPPGANESSIRVYSSACTNVLSNNQPVFGPDTLAPARKGKYQPMKKEGNVLIPDGSPKDIDNDVSVSLKTSVLSGKKDSITVNGFDYTNNWCGPVETNGVITGYHGNKITILIPIKMNPEALGGVGVETNGSGSGIYVDGENKFPFVSPKVNLPVNIIINKQGLDVGESSKFTILRSTDKTDWEEVTSVFVTRHKGQTPNEPRTRVEGLPATNNDGVEYIYKVREDDWSWSYTLTSDRELLSDDNDNPFTFTNRKKNNIDVNMRHAESKVTNTFKARADGGGEGYDDSKDNKRAVITVTSSTNSD